MTLAVAQEKERVAGEEVVDGMLAYEGGDHEEMPVEDDIDEDISEMPMIATFVNEFPDQVSSAHRVDFISSFLVRFPG